MSRKKKDEPAPAEAVVETPVPDHASRAHASLGASSAYRWIACPGSVRLSAGIESTSSVYAREGIAAHELCQMCLNSGQDAIEFIDREIDEFVVDEEMAEAVQVYLDAVRKVRNGSALTFVEKRFSLDKLMAGTELDGMMFGTNDCSVLVGTPTGKSKLFVFDYKHGRGVAVDALGNPQLRYYALGACLELAHHVIEEVEAVIVQPRARHRDGPIRSEVITPFELVEWSADLADAAQAALSPDAPLNPGDHCDWCPAAGACPALRSHAYAVAQLQFSPIDDTVITVPPAPETLTPEQLSRVLDAAEVVKDWIAAVQAHAHLQLDHGTAIPGWKLVDKRPSRKWLNDEETTAGALDLLGLDVADIYATKLRSPAQIEKALPMARHGELTGLWESKSSGTTIARDNDGRVKLSSKASADFSVLDAPQP